MSRLPEAIRPGRYSLNLHVDPRRDTFTGQVEIGIEAPAGTRRIELHSVDLELRDPAVEDAAGAVAVRKIVANPKRETVTLQLARGLRSKSAVIRLAFEGPLRTDLRGLYLARSGKRRYAATQLEAADARRFFPCFDEPDKKARFEITVTTAEKFAVVSNAPIRKTSRKGRNKTVAFRETPPLSTYLIALIVGEMEASRVRRCGDTPIRVWSVPGQQHLKGFALEAAVESLARLERYFGLPYPYEKLDLIAVPDFEFGAMENAGAVTFRETLLLVDPKTVTLAEKKRIAEVVAHELAHMWYGDLVTMAWWDDLWLNEAFATWMAFHVVDDWKPEWQMWLDFEHGRSAAFRLDSLRHTHPIYAEVRTPDEATENFDLITYEKGSSVVRMVEQWLGPAVFRRGVRRYIRRHRESNARGADLWAALEHASGRPVEPVVRAWIERPGFPLVSVERRDQGGEARVALTQERYRTGRKTADGDEPWPIPAVLRVGEKGRRPRLVRTLADQRTQNVKLGPVDRFRFVYANAAESGFYRPLHDAALLGALSESLSNLAPVERMGLLAHQWAGVVANRAPLADWLDLVDRLGNEPEPEVLHTALGSLDWLDDQVEPELAPRAAERFRGWLSARFTEEFHALGWTPRRGEADATRLRRAALLRITGALARDETVLSEVDSRIGAYLRDRATVDANLVGPLVELAARHGDKARYEKYLRVMRKAKTPQERVRFEFALASFRDPALTSRTLALALTDDVPTQDVVPLLGRLFANPDARDDTWEFVKRRWDSLSPRVSSGLASRLIQALPALKTRARRAEVRAFFKANPIPSAERTLRQTLEQFDLNAGLRKRLGRELRLWLERRP